MPIHYGARPDTMLFEDVENYSGRRCGVWPISERAGSLSLAQMEQLTSPTDRVVMSSFPFSRAKRE